MLSLRALLPLAGLALMACGGDAEDPAAMSSTPGSVQIREHVVYGEKYGMALTLDVYTPAEPNGAGVLYMNSGGWFSPVSSFVDRDGGQLRLRDGTNPRRLVDRGFTVFNVRHGSAPRFVLPEVVDDVRKAIRHVRTVAPEYGVDPDRLGVWGGSAGGHLALMLGTASEIGPVRPEDAPAAPAAPVAAVVAYYPPTDLATADSTANQWAADRDQEMTDVFPALDFPEELRPELSPVNFATPDDPPTLLIHGDADPLVSLGHSEAMLEALQAAGVPAELLVLEGAEHGFEGRDAEEAAERLVEWFQRFLGR